MHKTSSDKDINQNPKEKPQEEEDGKVEESVKSARFQNLECAVTAKKPKKKPAQRTDFHPRPPFSCVPIYTAILLGLLIVLIVGAVTTIVDMRPAFIYGDAGNTTHLHLNKTLTSIIEPPPPISFSTLKPQ